MRFTLVAVLFSLAADAQAGAQSLSAALPGKTAERIRSAANETQTYAVHLPAAYDTTRSWPVAFLMDPRGHALTPLERMRAAADRFGYILLSSYNTISDSATDANVLAVNAMLADAQKSLRIDTRRIYLVGFSGTARIAWNFADGLKTRVAGILGAGASGLNYVLELQGKEPVKPAYYGTIGTTDFNYEEMRSFEPWLAQQSIPRRVRYFSGGHQWPADSLFAEALAWFELRAMKDGLRAVDPAFVDSMYKADLRTADGLESGNRKLEALAHWREIGADYDGLANVDNARVRVRSLLNERQVKRAISEREELHQGFIEFSRELAAWIAHARSEEHIPEANEAIRKLKVDQRVKRAGDQTQPTRALAAQRELEQAYVTLSFYQPKELLAKRDPARALVFLHVAERIKPRTSRVALFRAYAFLQQERADDALRALEQAIGAGMPRSLLADDPALTALRGNPRFQDLTAPSTR